MHHFLPARWALVWALSSAVAAGQIIEFESGGLKYQALTRNGLTIMLAELPSHVRDYSIVQVAISNGSNVTWTVKPEDFRFQRSDGSVFPAQPARTVVEQLVDRARRSDVIRLVIAYESSLYGNSRYKATNGYEVRRQSALAEVSSTRLKAAAAASAIALVQTKLVPGQSTDGAVFYATAGKPLGNGVVIVNAAGGVFRFPVVSSN